MDWSKLNTASLKGYLNVAILVAALFLSGAVTFPPGVSDATKQYILSWDSWLLTFVAGLNGVLHFMPDFTVPPPSASFKKVAALLLGALLFGAGSLGSPSAARAVELHVTSSTGDVPSMLILTAANNVGCPRGGCPVPAPVAPSSGEVPIPSTPPAPGSSTETKTILQLLLSIQQQVIADLTANLAAAQTPLPQQTAGACEKPATWNSATSACSTVEVQDPLGAACFAASITFVNDLAGIGGVSGPTLVVNGGPLGLAENARLLDLAAKSAITDISFQGLPQYWKVGCDPWLLDYATQVNIDIVGLAGANALLMKFLPAPMLVKYNLKARF